MLCLKCHQAIEDAQEHYGLHLSCFKKWFGVSGAVEFVNLQRRSSSSELSLSSVPTNMSFFHGRFKKYSCELDGIAYILKMRQKDAIELPEVEYLCNQLAKQLSIPVAEFFYINFLGDKTFVTKNFIISGGSPVDLQHIYHFRKDTEHSCDGIIRAIIENTKKPYDVKTIINVILFDALIGNHDRHGRNLAFIAKSTEYVLSPIYDNVSYLALESGEMLKADYNPSGKISTNTTYEPSMRDYVQDFKRLGYIDEVINFYNRIKLDEIEKLVETSFCSELMKAAISKLIKKRHQEIESELLN